MRGRGTLALTYEVKVSFRRLRPHEHLAVEPGFRAIVAVANLPDGPEEQPWAAPARDVKAALNPRRRDFARMLEAGRIPPGWQRL